MSVEAMKQMVEALQKAKRQCHYHNIPPHGAYDDAIEAGRQAIAEAEKQEQANFCERCGKRLGKNNWDIHTCTPPQPKQEQGEPVIVQEGDILEIETVLYTTQQPRKPLTDEEISEILIGIYGSGVHHDDYVFARAIEAAHGIKDRLNGK